MKTAVANMPNAFIYYSIRRFSNAHIFKFNPQMRGI
jgi:hypothetical protein